VRMIEDHLARCIKNESNLQMIDSKASHKVKHIPLLHHTNNPQREELALLQPHNETTVHLETKDKAQTANKGYEIMAGENVI